MGETAEAVVFVVCAVVVSPAIFSVAAGVAGEMAAAVLFDLNRERDRERETEREKEREKRQTDRSLTRTILVLLLTQHRCISLVCVSNEGIKCGKQHSKDRLSTCFPS